MEKSLSMMPHKEAVLYVLRGNNPAIGFMSIWGLCLPVIHLRRIPDLGNIVELEMMRTGR